MNRYVIIKKLFPFSFFLVIFLLIAGCKNADNTLAPPPPGPQWVTFKRPDVTTLLDNKINSFAIGVDGKVWIATDSGATTFNQSVWGLVRDSLAYPVFGSGGTSIGYKVNTISPGIDGSVWFGLDGGGVKRYHSGSASKVWQTYSSPSVSSGFITSISADILQVGDVWVTSSLGVNRYVPSTTIPDEGTWRTYTTSNVPQIPTNQVISSAYDNLTNSVWFGTYSRGTFFFTINNSGIENWANLEFTSDNTGPIVSIAFDRSNTVWFAKNAGLGAGVTSYNPLSGTITHYNNTTTSGTIPASGVNAVVTDLDSTRWFGTNEGLIRFKGSTWTTFTTSTTAELPSNIITSLIIDRRGNLWIGTANGIAVFNEEGTRLN